MAGPVAFLAPDPIQSTQLIPGGNTPAAGGLLFCYNVGTTNKQNTYTDQTASTARTNPIVLDSGGNIPGNGEVWITSTCKFVFAPSNDGDPPSSPYWTRDNYYGINNITAAQVQSLTTVAEWILGSTAIFVGAGSFAVSGDQTAIYTLGRRIKAAVTGGDRFGSVSSQALASGSTTVGVLLDSGTLNAGLTSVQYGLLGTPNGSVPWSQITATGLNFSAVSTGVLTASSASANSVSTASIWNVTSVVVPGSLNISTAALNITSTSILDFIVTSATPLISTAAISLNINLAGGSLRVNGNAGIGAASGDFVGSVLARDATAPSGTISDAYLMGNVTPFGIFFGSGLPTTAAQRGSLYLRSDGTNTTSRIYVNSGSGLSTSWTYLTAGA